MSVSENNSIYFKTSLPFTLTLLIRNYYYHDVWIVKYKLFATDSWWRHVTFPDLSWPENNHGLFRYLWCKSQIRGLLVFPRLLRQTCPSAELYEFVLKIVYDNEAVDGTTSGLVLMRWWCVVKFSYYRWQVLSVHHNPPDTVGKVGC